MTVTVKFAFEPLQIVAAPARTAVDGRAFTVKELVVADAEHPLLFVAVNVNVPPVDPIVTLGL